MRFLVVTHEWFVDSKGFDVQEVEADSLAQAITEGIVIQYRKAGAMNHCAFKVVAVEDHERLASRKLTWAERLTGKLEVV